MRIDRAFSRELAKVEGAARRLGRAIFWWYEQATEITGMSRMKRLVAALTIIMVFSILSCGTRNEKTGKKVSQSEQAAQDERRARMEKAIAEVKYDVPAEIDINYEVLDDIDTSASPLGVVPLPTELGKTLNGLFSKYTKHMAPNGKPIHVFAQSGVSDLQVARAREILKYHLTDAPGTQYGQDKSAIANRMADVRATLIYTDTETKSFATRPILKGSKLRIQDLYATESPVEGGYEYIHNKARPGHRFTRDASYEEIMHLVHAKGLEDVLPAYHQEIVEAEKAAVKAGIYLYGRPAPHEYIITGFDIYFGLWDHNPQGDVKSFGHEYPFHTKAEMKAGDPALYELVEKFWPRYLTYDAYIDPSFEGTFSTVLDEKTAYTFKSQYLVNILLTGQNYSNILGNDQDNRLTGNDGNNLIIGGKGNDLIAGGGGEDTAEFSGNTSEYEIKKADHKITVTDSFFGRDGKDELTGVETLKFKDRTLQSSQNSEDRDVVTLPEIDISGSPNGIVPFPDTVPAVFTDVFVKYTKVTAPNGRPIHLLAQADWTDDKLIKVRNILEHMLTDFPGSAYGSDKTKVANAMSDRKAAMVLFNNSQVSQEAMRGPLSGATDLRMQSMWANEIAAEGSDDYMRHITRDASYEEVWHLVHETGVIPALLKFQSEIETAKDAAVKIGWGPPNDDPSSWHSEYYAQQYDNYLDLWVVQPKVWEGRKLKPGEMPEGTAHWGQNQVNSRGELLELDPVGYELIEKFFHPYLTYRPQLPVDFEGTFSIEFDKALVYTHKSQHLKNVTLRGSKNANLIGNAFDNVLTGNAGNNILTGGRGDDWLLGGDGDDTAVFFGVGEDYTITKGGKYVAVKDNRVNRDGTDTLISIEFLQFSNRKVKI
jgi:Ca2+-binding RTX toxin-like protein